MTVLAVFGLYAAVHWMLKGSADGMLASPSCDAHPTATVSIYWYATDHCYYLIPGTATSVTNALGYCTPRNTSVVEPQDIYEHQFIWDQIIFTHGCQAWAGLSKDALGWAWFSNGEHTTDRIYNPANNGDMVYMITRDELAITNAGASYCIICESLTGETATTTTTVATTTTTTPPVTTTTPSAPVAPPNPNMVSAYFRKKVDIYTYQVGRYHSGGSVLSCARLCIMINECQFFEQLIQVTSESLALGDCRLLSPGFTYISCATSAVSKCYERLSIITPLK